MLKPCFPHVSVTAYSVGTRYGDFIHFTSSGLDPGDMVQICQFGPCERSDSHKVGNL